jgi:Uma2 family endonuclease
MAGVSNWHVIVSKNLMEVFIRRFKKDKYVLRYAPFDVFLEDNTVVQPDLVVCDRDKVKNNGIYGAPELVIEILSPSSIERDVKEKFEIYEKNHVLEYWVVDPRSQYVKIFILKEGRFVDGVLYDFTDNKELKIPISFIEDYEIALKDIFQED